MKRKNIDERRIGYLENVRFFRYLPEATRESLSVEQRRSIARTIMELQKSNPRILQEIYLESPQQGKPGRPSMWLRIKRRMGLALSWMWLSFFLHKSERRVKTSLFDYLFLFITLLVTVAFGVFILFLLYGLKNMVGIDIIPGVHFFYVE